MVSCYRNKRKEEDIPATYGKKKIMKKTREEVSLKRFAQMRQKLLMWPLII
jgi:hypothetical protein